MTSSLAPEWKFMWLRSHAGMHAQACVHKMVILCENTQHDNNSAGTIVDSICHIHHIARRLVDVPEPRHAFCGASKSHETFI